MGRLFSCFPLLVTLIQTAKKTHKNSITRNQDHSLTLTKITCIQQFQHMLLLSEKTNWNITSFEVSNASIMNGYFYGSGHMTNIAAAPITSTDSRWAVVSEWRCRCTKVSCVRLTDCPERTKTRPYRGRKIQHNNTIT